MTTDNPIQDHYAADRPIIAEKDDRFKRYPFARRIAETIINRKSQESIVLGLFGAWGEGKSSVLNFIDQELKKDDDIIVIHFNPWRYGDEDSLLKNFFKKIATALEKELQNKKEKWSGFVSKYSGGAKIFGFDIGSVSKAMADIAIETLKERVDEFLHEANNKLVVFIDDIDRLDKQEIYSLLRLVKLTADFPNTTYVLSFDENMVAAAIGERFGTGDIKAGTSFLEKIIQVPLTIPKALPQAINKFCIDLVTNAFVVNGLQLSENEGKDFIEQFSSYLLPLLTTPRLAIRYGNALAFSLPLLNGEVYTVDLMLIEAIKVFYPTYYQFIKQNPDYFTGSYHLYENSKDEDKIARYNALTAELNKELNHRQKSSIVELLSFLFPTLATIYENYEIGEKTRNKLYLNKRIGSTYYFERYFSYAVVDGDISDIEFDQLIKNVSVKNVDEISADMTDMIAKSDPGNFIFKLRSKETELDWELGQSLIKSLIKITDLLPHQHGSLLFGYESTRGQAALFIYQFLKHQKSATQDIFYFAKELMTLPADGEFAYTLNKWLRTGNTPEEKLFTNEQYNKLAEIFTDRILSELCEESFFEKFADTSPDKIHLMTSTLSERSKVDFQSYTEKYLNKHKTNVLVLLKSIIPMGRSNIREGEYKTDITRSVYNHMIYYFDKDDLYRRLLENFAIEEIEKDPCYLIDFGEKEYSDLNMARQFIKWYREDLKIEEVIS